MTKNLAIIPLRSGSKRIKDKILNPLIKSHFFIIQFKLR